MLSRIRGERDIAVGNVVGSNIFNMFCRLGLSAAFVSGEADVSDTTIRLEIPR